MPSDLRITVFRGCAFFKIHCLENGVLSVLLFDCKRGGLYFPLTFQGGVLGFLFFLFGSIVSEKVMFPDRSGADPCIPGSRIVCAGRKGLRRDEL